MLKRRMNIKQKVWIASFLMLVLVLAVGFLTYREFAKVLENARNAGKTDPVVNTTKKLLNQLDRAEIQVKTYSLTEDSLYLDQYEACILLLEQSLNKLSDQRKITQIKKVPFDSLEALVFLKIELLDSLILLQNEFRVEGALSKVSESLDEAVINVEPQEEPEPEKPKRRLFNRKKKNETPVIADETVRMDYEEVTSSLAKIRVSETAREENQLMQELSLLKIDKRYESAIQEILNQLEKEELELINKGTENTERIVRRAEIQIVLFCIMLTLLVLAMGYTILRYITRSNRYRKVLKRAKNEAESLALAKEHFAATVSHEIRTPMNIISGFAEQLSNSKLNAQQQDQLQTILKASSHLLNLINDVLDFTKLQNYKLELEAKPFAIREVTQQLFDLMKPLADARGIELECRVDERVPPVLIGDSIRLSQMLINLVSNAIKFTHEGVVSLHIDATQVDAHFAGLEISVADTGIGMSPEQLTRIFEAYEQASQSTTRTYGGTGLGLAITKKLVDVHGGEISVHSKVDQGTEILLELRYPVGELSLLEDGMHLGAQHLDLTGKQLLIADDEPYNRKLLLTILKKYDAQYVEASTGRQAVDLAGRMRFDLILMDARMPEMNGLDASKHIRAAGLNMHTPIVALTAAVSEEDHRNYEAAGINSVLAKPYKEAQLIQIIQQSLGNSAPSAPVSSTEKEAQGNSVLNFAHLKELSNGDRTFYLEMLETFVRGVENGLSELSTQHAAGNLENLQHIAHRMCAPCKHLEADALYQLLKTLELRAQALCESGQLVAHLDEIKKIAESVVKIVNQEIKLTSQNTTS
jgi:signal transduction histidine kinase/CheY-like chemotaxis protein/HPt (histidine-containing phosphotransfer) domain-containing protein